MKQQGELHRFGRLPCTTHLPSHNSKTQYIFRIKKMIHHFYFKDSKPSNSSDPWFLINLIYFTNVVIVKLTQIFVFTTFVFICSLPLPIKVEKSRRLPSTGINRTSNPGRLHSNRHMLLPVFCGLIFNKTATHSLNRCDQTNCFQPFCSHYLWKRAKNEPPGDFLYT